MYYRYAQNYWLKKKSSNFLYSKNSTVPSLQELEALFHVTESFLGVLCVDRRIIDSLKKVAVHLLPSYNLLSAATSDLVVLV